MFVLALVASAIWLVNCDGKSSIPNSPCNPNTCIGCCDGDICRAGSKNELCGAGAAACRACGNDQICYDKQCTKVGACSPADCAGCCDQTGNCVEDPQAVGLCGTGGGDCSRCEGTSVCLQGICGGGGTCNAAACDGCCDEGRCVEPGNSDEACGPKGGSCENCAVQKLECDTATRQCRAKCNAANCDGCCKDSDGDGVVDSCVKIADVSTTECGKDGVKCSDCSGAKGGCDAAKGQCNDCLAQCAGKCAGAPDDCGKTCPSNDCDGCCDAISHDCKPGTAVSACGFDGDRCRACPTLWTCNASKKGCDPCQGKSDGTVCTVDQGTGKCRAEVCCLGCWDAQANTCNTKDQLTNGSSCGTQGNACERCASGSTCDHGACKAISSGPRWEVYGWSVSIVDSPQRGGAKAWDPFALTSNASKPDPYILVDWSKPCSIYDAQANWTNDGSNGFAFTWADHDPQYGQLLATKYEAELISKDACFYVVDSDVGADEVIALCEHRLTLGELNGIAKIFVNCPSPEFNNQNFIDHFELRFNKLP